MQSRAGGTGRQCQCARLVLGQPATLVEQLRERVGRTFIGKQRQQALAIASRNKTRAPSQRIDPLRVCRDPSGIVDAEFPDQQGRYSAMAREAGESRIYGGIHYRIDVDAGFDIARQVAARARKVSVPADRLFVPVGR